MFCHTHPQVSLIQRDVRCVRWVAHTHTLELLWNEWSICHNRLVCVSAFTHTHVGQEAALCLLRRKFSRRGNFSNINASFPAINQVLFSSLSERSLGGVLRNRPGEAMSVCLAIGADHRLGDKVKKSDKRSSTVLFISIISGDSLKYLNLLSISTSPLRLATVERSFFQYINAPLRCLQDPLMQFLTPFSLKACGG